MMEVDTLSRPTSMSLGPTIPWSKPQKWRGYGGGKPSMKSIEFDQQLDKIAIWLEQWDHDQVKLQVLRTTRVIVFLYCQPKTRFFIVSQLSKVSQNVSQMEASLSG